MKKVFYMLIISVLSAISFSGCSSENEAETDIIGSFIKEVNEDSSFTGIHASEENNMVVLTLKLEDTPENQAKIYLLRHDDPSMEIFEKKITESLGEGHFLARIVKEKKRLAFRVASGDESFTLEYEPQTIREVAFKNQ